MFHVGNQPVDSVNREENVAHLFVKSNDKNLTFCDILYFTAKSDHEKHACCVHQSTDTSHL